jgi:hypothetical protein
MGAQYPHLISSVRAANKYGMGEQEIATLFKNGPLAGVQVDGQPHVDPESLKRLLRGSLGMSNDLPKRLQSIILSILDALRRRPKSFVVVVGLGALGVAWLASVEYYDQLGVSRSDLPLSFESALLGMLAPPVATAVVLLTVYGLAIAVTEIGAAFLYGLWRTWAVCLGLVLSLSFLSGLIGMQSEPIITLLSFFLYAVILFSMVRYFLVEFVERAKARLFASTVLLGAVVFPIIAYFVQAVGQAPAAGARVLGGVVPIEFISDYGWLINVRADCVSLEPLNLDEESQSRLPSTGILIGESSGAYLIVSAKETLAIPRNAVALKMRPIESLGSGGACNDT